MKTAPLLVPLALGACALLNPDAYRHTPTAELCRQLMVFPSYNVNHPARMAELERRGESCGNPADIAAAQRDADAKNAELLRSIPPPAAPAVPPPPQTCVFRLVAGQWVTVCQ